MLTLTATKAAVEPSEGGVWFKVLVPYSEAQQARQFVLRQKDKPYSVEVKEKREKRSLDANGLLWLMLTKLSEAVGEAKNDLYLRYVREYGPFKDFVLTQEEAKTFSVAWSMLGVGWQVEKVDFDEDGDRVVVRAYYGSSSYSKKQMSRVLDAILQDARAVGLEVLSERELSLLKEDWHGNLETR